MVDCGLGFWLEQPGSNGAARIAGAGDAGAGIPVGGTAALEARRAREVSLGDRAGDIGD